MATFNYKLALQLPYMMIINRVAHYIKKIQLENIGSEATRETVQKEMNDWVRGYVADQDNAPPEVIRNKPLRKAKVLVEDVEDDPGWYRVRLEVQPHIKLQGMYVTLSLNGRLDKWGKA
jgi:type VI secretion system protein ImpC